MVILVDDANLDARNRNLIFHNLEQYLRDRLQTGDQVMLVRLGDSIEQIQDFIDRSEELLAALEGMKKNVGAGAQWEGERRMFLARLRVASLAPRPQGGRNQRRQPQLRRRHRHRLATGGGRALALRAQHPTLAVGLRGAGAVHRLPRRPARAQGPASK